MIDLHCHSHYSDGVLTPQELVALGVQQGLRCLSLTDHDTLAGYPEIVEAAAGTGITIKQGIEISARWKKYDIHILGYGVTETPAFALLIAQQNACRTQRAQAIGALLDNAGVGEAYAKACALAGHSRIARPHFAKVLLEAGMVRDMAGAFKQFLGRGKKAYVPTQWVSLQEAVEGIRACGGQAVIAHPMKYGLTRSKLHELIVEFLFYGGEGIEVVSGESSVAEINTLAALSLRFELLASSGSDYHGGSTARVKLGAQRALPALCKPLWHAWNI